MVPSAVDEDRLGQVGEVEEPLGHGVGAVGTDRERDPALADEPPGCRVGRCRRPRSGPPWPGGCLRPAGGGRWRPGPAPPPGTGTHQLAKNRRTAGWPLPPPSAGTPTAAPPPRRGREKVGTGPAGLRPARRCDPVPMPVNRPMPRATASTTPTRRKIGRGRRGSPGRPVGPAPSGLPPSGLPVRLPGIGRHLAPAPGRSGKPAPPPLPSVVADEDVAGHGHEEHRQVGDRVAEQPHGVRGRSPGPPRARIHSRPAMARKPAPSTAAMTV